MPPEPQTLAPPSNLRAFRFVVHGSMLCGEFKYIATGLHKARVEGFRLQGLHLVHRVQGLQSFGFRVYGVWGPGLTEFRVMGS